jgi:ADP-ribosylglycohydrolase
MLGAIAGDITGSVYESPFAEKTIKTTDFPLFSPGCRFTDDTVLTVAVADCLLTGAPYAEKFRDYYRRYPWAGFSRRFRAWAESGSAAPYNARTNGSAMRVSPVGFARDTLDEVLEEAHQSAIVTHNHPEGIKGAQAIAAAVFLARTGCDKEEMKEFLTGKFAYGLDEPLQEIRRHSGWDTTCAVTVPQALRAFLESSDFETAVRNAVSLGGDTDTLACMAGAVAHACYRGVPAFIAERVFDLLDGPLAEVTRLFLERFRCP